MKSKKVSPEKSCSAGKDSIIQRRNQLQLQLIDEVNHKHSSVSSSEPSLSFSTDNVASEKNASRSRVQRVPKTAEMQPLLSKEHLLNHNKFAGKGELPNETHLNSQTQPSET